jgi:hypothetical protein
MKRKKTTKGRKPGKTAAKNKSEANPKPETNPAEVRREVCKMVEAEAAEMAKAAIHEAKNGQLAPMKYLFEMAGIYPPSPDEAQVAPEEDSLAKILLDRLKLAATPVENHDEGATNAGGGSLA